MARIGRELLRLRRLKQLVADLSFDKTMGQGALAFPRSTQRYTSTRYPGRPKVIPVGAQASIAVSTDRVQALSVLRTIILRPHSWENFVF